LIDLHSHTSRSDGTLSPRELIEEAARAGVSVLGITDHDTFAGYDEACPYARQAGIELLCGIELSTKLHGYSVHLLGYFLQDPQTIPIRDWVWELQSARRDRNARLISRLQDLGLDITLAEVEARGRGMTGRPHFAQILVEKGYVADYQEAFDEYLDESAKGYVYRREPQLDEAIRRVRASNGVASLAHPIRLKEDLPSILPELCAAGLNALEAYHSDHSQAQTKFFAELAAKHGLLVSGGSDFHGGPKPDVKLGTGRNGNLAVPADIVQWLRVSTADLSPK
jgi:3',5'-nucleoside bisphosphate phosphatase